MNLLSSDVISLINTTYAREKTHTDHIDIELEIRFKNYQDGVGISKNSFIKMVENFSKMSESSVIIETTDFISGDIRRTLPETKPGYNPIIWIRKENLWYRDNRDYMFKISMNRETKIDPQNEEKFQPTRIRKKKRYSFPISGGKMRLDLTEVKTDTYSSKGIISHELELEILDPSSITNLNRVIEIILKQLHDTNEIYNKTLYDKMVNYVNTTLGSKKFRFDGLFDHKVLFQARNLHLKDMVYGGLVGNEREIYTVTHKADGIRKLLVIHPSGIWLIMAPGDANLITSKISYHGFNGFILEGELIPRNSRRADGIKQTEDVPLDELRGKAVPKELYWYMIYDTLSIPEKGIGTNVGTRSIQKEPHTVRMTMAQQVSAYFSKINIDNFLIHTKEFKSFPGVPDFFKIMRQFERERKFLPYYTDGLIFTPEFMAYNSGNDKLPLSKRNLTRYSDICKWKPQSQLTIDFEIHREMIVSGEEVLNLYVGGDKGGEVLFEGTKMNFYKYSMVDDMNELTEAIPNGSIVEYQWNYEREKLIPYKVRTEKTRPNRKEFADDTWDLIQNPISMETLEGDDFTLLRKYHNKIKWGLYSRMKNLFPKNISLLDIGSGRGGDVLKWIGFSQIVAVEPNLDHINDYLIPRIKSVLDQDSVQIITNTSDIKNKVNSALINKDKVIIINSGGEETELITEVISMFIGRKVDIVSMMLSLSFFWENEHILDSLISTITSNLSPIGEFMFFTIDGDAVNETFNPKFQTGYPATYYKFGSAELWYNESDNTLKINIPNTIVVNQTEWLVFIDDLRLKLAPYGFRLGKIYRSDKEGFLNNGERNMTSLYSYGWFSPSVKYTITSDEYCGMISLKKSEIISTPIKKSVDPKIISPPTKKIPHPGSMAHPIFPATSHIPTISLSPSSIPTILPPSTVRTTSTVPSIPIGPIKILSPTRIPSIVPTVPIRILSPNRIPSIVPTVPIRILSPIRIPSVVPSTVPIRILSPIRIPSVPPTVPIKISSPTKISYAPSTVPIRILSPTRIPSIVSPTVPIRILSPTKILSPTRIPSIVPPTVPTIVKIPSILTVPSKLPGIIPTTSTVFPIPSSGSIKLPTFAPTLAPTSGSIRLPTAPTSISDVSTISSLSHPQFLSMPTLAGTGSMREELPSLRIYHNQKTDRGIGDDVSENIKVPWFTKNSVVRIACIGDGSCFFHSVLKSFYQPYANNPSYSNRTKIAKNFRKDLAYNLSQPDPNTGNKFSHYETAAKGVWAEMSDFQKNEGMDLKDSLGMPIDYSIEGLQRLFDSDRDVGSEVYGYVADILGIGINVMIATKNNLVPSDVGGNMKNSHPYEIFIAGNGHHYEIIGVDHGKEIGIQTVFSREDPFMVAFTANSYLGDILYAKNVILSKYMIYIKSIMEIYPDLKVILESDDANLNKKIIDMLPESNSIIVNSLYENKLSSEELYQKALDLSKKAFAGENVINELIEIKNNINSIQDVSTDIVGEI